MESIPNYDNWKMRPYQFPDEQRPICYCRKCKIPLYEGDMITDPNEIGMILCEECGHDWFDKNMLYELEREDD